MKTNVFYGCFFLSIFLTAYGNQPEELLRKAEQYYNEKKYTEALHIYEQLEKEGWKSASFYYNMGNIYFRNGKLGHAIWKYEQASKLNPHDPGIHHNLQVCYSKTIDQLEVNENFFIQTFKQGLVFRLSEKKWGIISLVFSFLSALLVLFSLKSDNLRPILIPLSVVALVFCILSRSFGKMVYRETQRSAFAVVLDKEIKVTSEPLDNAFTKFRLHEGAKIRVEEVQDEYTLIKLSNGNEGWVKNKSLGFI